MRCWGARPGASPAACDRSRASRGEASFKFGLGATLSGCRRAAHLGKGVVKAPASAAAKSWRSAGPGRCRPLKFVTVEHWRSRTHSESFVPVERDSQHSVRPTHASMNATSV